MHTPPTDPWPGYRFRCEGVQCGACCSGKHGAGAVWVDMDEMEALALDRGLSLRAFVARFTRRVGARWSLIENDDLDCIFYVQGAGCAVYEARPRQCRSYPFWPRIVASPATWAEEAGCCPGIGAGEDVEARVRAARAQSGGTPTCPPPTGKKRAVC